MTREEAIEVVKEAFIAWESEYRVPHEDWTEAHKARDMAIEALSEEKTGEWIKTYMGQRTRITCSNCGQSGRKISDNFCPNCGARMVGDNDEK